MSDDSLVADALLLLRHSEPTLLPKKVEASPIKLKWNVRQRRSKKGDQTRASPTTPLSLSGATSLSGGSTTVEGLGESSATVKPSETFRSKVCLDHFHFFFFLVFPIWKLRVARRLLGRHCFVRLWRIHIPRDAAFQTVIGLLTSSLVCLGLSISDYTLDLTQTATRRDLGSIHDRPSLNDDHHHIGTPTSSWPKYTHRGLNIRQLDVFLSFLFQETISNFLDM